MSVETTPEMPVPVLRDSYTAGNRLLLMQTLDRIAEERVPDGEVQALDALAERSGLTHQDIARIVLKSMARDQGLRVQDLEE